MNFFMPVKLFTGDGCIAKEQALFHSLGKRCVLVTGPHAAEKSGALKDVTELLHLEDIDFSVFNEICQNPTVESCIQAGKAARETNADFIIGIGGGSAMDAAKAAAVFAANPELDENGFYSGKWQNKPLPVLLVGTTSGTGSEVTKVSVLTDSRHRKHSIKDDRLFALASFGDSRYTRELPLPITLSTGVDVLAHCAESYFSKKADEISRGFAVRGIRLLFDPLLAAAEGKPLTPQQREQLYQASIFGGLAINTTSTCFPHNVGYFLTEWYGVPHGVACATFLPDLFLYEEDFDPAYTESFYREVGLNKEEVLALIGKCLPKNTISLTEEEIRLLLPRWENNGSVNNTRGTVDIAFIFNVLKDKYLIKGE
ncbi:MAG: iron-containing alcohol dehydrogenase [Oscillospiraceae bacterium]|nr:iron-containing alcohol dehydrogenase [Oscillospiraceae bacterium]